MGRLRLLFVMAGCIKISALVLIFFVCASYERPQFNLGSIFTNGIGAAFNTAIGRDCKAVLRVTTSMVVSVWDPSILVRDLPSQWTTDCLSTAIKVSVETS